MRMCIYLFLDYVIEKMIMDGNNPFIYEPVLYRKQLFSSSMTSYDHPPPPPEVTIDGFIGIDIFCI